MTRSKFSTKVVLLATGIGLSVAAFPGSQPAAAGVGYYGYYYGDPYGAYGTVKRWGAPIYHHGLGHGIGQGSAPASTRTGKFRVSSGN
jgi:hypothetical protein